MVFIFISSGGVLATYFTIKRSLFLVTLTYGLLTNFGQSIAYGPTAQNAVLVIYEIDMFSHDLLEAEY